MTEHVNPDDNWNLLFDGYTAEGLLVQCQLWHEWMQGTYFSSIRRTARNAEEGLEG